MEIATQNIIAKIFTTGNSQAVRLPKAFRFDTDRVFINKNEYTGEVSLKPYGTEAQRIARLTKLFADLRQDHHDSDVPMPRRYDVARDPFADDSEQGLQ